MDLDELKRGAATMWGLGDYRPIAEAIFPEAVALAEACDVRPGTSVLDVAAGTGNVAIAAARMGATVVASDLSPQMVAWGRERTAAEGLDVEWHEADAEDLPFEDERFDVVVSAFGAMFAPRPEVVANELFRVARTGGIVAMANWTADGFSGRSAALIASFAPPSPFELPTPTAWGEPGVVERRFAGLVSSLALERSAATFRFPSVESARAFFRANTGGEVILRRMAPDAFAAFDEEMLRLTHEFARPQEGGIVIENAYLRVVARKR